LEAAHPAESKSQSSWIESLGFLSVLSSNAMLLYLILGWVAERCYVSGFSSLAELGSTRKKASAGMIDRVVDLLTRPFPKAMRLLLLKDLKVFRRDILQWSQFVIFFGLLTFYFLNARRLHYGNTVSSWMMVVGYLNLGVVGLLLATFTTRFIYPLISLEGRKFWILGTLPINRWDILLSKFLFACGVSLVPCSILILLSDLMLKMGDQSPWVMVLHQYTCIVLCFGLCGIAVGMGARLPNLREAAPAKIASGFGGTLTLVLSVLFILSTVCATAVPVCFWLHRPYIPEAGGLLEQIRLGTWGAVIVGVMATAILGVAATMIPMVSGFRAFKDLEP
jgi:ABC-2 type transport system permease protein